MDMARLSAGDGSPDGADIHRRLAEAFDNGRPQLFTWHTKSRDGGQWWAEVLLQRFRVGREDRILSIVRDISDRQRAEQEQYRLQQQLYQAQKMEAVGTLAAGMAHDFNNLITAIAGYTEMARVLNSERKDATEALDGIEQVSREASGVSQSLLAFSRKPGTEKEPLQLGRFVAESAVMLRRILPVNIEITTDIEDEMALWVEADETQLRQVIVNLAVHARAAMPAGGCLRLTLGHRVGETHPPAPGRNERDAEVAVLTVEDSGAGMSQDSCDHIFEPFVTTRTRGQGTGLGMAVVHGIVMDHGGNVCVRSQEEQGTCVTVTLPRCRPPKAADGPPDVGPLAADRQETIILAEDNLHVQRTASRGLNDQGYRVVEAANGVEAMAAYVTYREAVRLVILDCDLPEKSGIACLKEIRAESSDVPILVITGSVDIPLSLGDETNVAVLPKPFTPRDLSTMVHQMLVLKRGRS